VLAGLERPDTGTVTVLGTDLASLNRPRLAALRRAHLAISAQESMLVDTEDVTANLELARQVRGLDATAELIDYWLDALGLAPLRHRPVRLLSGGERQRVSVARALVAEPAIAILDEPTSQQDEANAERLVSALLAATRRGTTVVAATHDPVLAAAADDVLRLD
jgi:ABC-type lipoprotein export system ATPase subunit